MDKIYFYFTKWSICTIFSYICFKRCFCHTIIIFLWRSIIFPCKSERNIIFVNSFYRNTLANQWKNTQWIRFLTSMLAHLPCRKHGFHRNIRVKRHELAILTLIRWPATKHGKLILHNCYCLPSASPDMRLNKKC